MQSDDNSILRAKDVIAVEVDSLGVLAIPSSNEPLPEQEETISHLRVANVSEMGIQDYTRCMFRVETDSGQVGTP
eukprot:scaffold2297_cov153-Ochromonas_danica.AAC.8